MQIDWFTVIAQIINFLILIALLKHFLYEPIIRAMDEREEKIASRLEAAEKQKEDADREAESYRHKQRELAEMREGMLSQSKEEAEAFRKTLMNTAREEVSMTQTRWVETIEREKEAFLHELRQRVRKHVYDIARRALADLANAELEQQMIDVFITRLQGIDKANWKEVLESLRQSGQGIVIHSAFGIPKEAEERMVQVMPTGMDSNINVRFETSADVICGIELKASGYKIAWSLENYVEALEESISEVLEEELKSTAG